MTSTKNKNFKFDGPHRPLVQLSEHKSVASTGPSAFAKVGEGLQVFGGKGYFSPLAEHWHSLLVKYHDERDLLHWVNTGKHLPSLREGRSRRTNKPRQKQRIKVSVSLDEMLAGMR